ncbi:MAG: type II secretion system protein J [Candidatus Omnitrophota bacterium]
MINTRSAGFTLIELLLAVSIFTLVSVGLYTGFVQGLFVQERFSALDDILDDMYWAQYQLEKDLANAVAAGLDDAAFTGREDGLCFLTDDGGILTRVCYRTADPVQEERYQVVVRHIRDVREGKWGNGGQADRPRVFVRWSLPLHAEDGESAEIVLARNVEAGSLTFSYAYRDEAGQGEILWQSTWGEEGVLPAGVRLRIGLVSPDQQKESYPVDRKFFVPAGQWTVRDGV